jgi:exonuclease-1
MSENKVLFKMDRDGNANEILGDRLAAVTDVNFNGWSLKEFRHMCILSGCDYLKNIEGIGLRTAYKFLRKHKSVDKVRLTLARRRTFKH